jgi:HEAT repeat protein
MKKRSSAVLIFLAACAVGAAGLYVFHPREPSFEGRRFSQWVLTMNSEKPGPQKEEARAVVRHLGTNSIPLLLRWLREPDTPSLNERFINLKSKAFGWLAAHRIIKPRSITTTGRGPNHRTIAAWALAELDSASKKTVIPALISMLSDKSHEPGGFSELAGKAFIVLPTMAPESIGPLIDALSNQDTQVWALAEGALGNIGPVAKAAIPVLEKRLVDKDPNIRVGAAETIGKLGGDPDEFVPVVIKSLPEVNRDNLDHVLDILVRYKEHAKTAIPVLVAILSNTPESTNTTDIIVRAEVRSALREIDAEAAAKAGAQ